MDSRIEHVHSDFYNDFEGLFDDDDNIPALPVANNSNNNSN